MLRPKERGKYPNSAHPKGKPHHSYNLNSYIKQVTFFGNHNNINSNHFSLKAVSSY